MTTWAHDRSDSWKWIDGVDDASIYPPQSDSATAVKVRKDTLTRKEISGGVFGIMPTDEAFFVWLAVPVQEGRIVVGSESWTVLSVDVAPDGAMCRAIVRKRV